MDNSLKQYKALTYSFLIIIILLLMILFLQYDDSQKQKIQKAYDAGYLKGIEDGKEIGVELATKEIRNYKFKREEQ